MSTGLRAGTNNDGYLQVNGTDVLTALSSGNIGIGTNVPTNLLHISGVSAPLRVYNTSSNGFELIRNSKTFGFNANYAALDTHSYIGADIGMGLAFATNGDNERVRISSTGNVGIGTTNPLLKLDTRGALHVGGGIDGIWLGNAGDNSAYDNVKLYYTGYNGGGPRIYLTPRTQPGSGTLNTFLYLQSNFTGGPGANTMGLLVDGSVGIGTNSPQSKLHLVSGGIVGGTGRGGSYTKTLFESNDSVGAYWEFQTPPTSTVNDILFSRGASGDYGIIGYNNSNNSMRFFTNSNQRMTIDSAGNVGFGTTTPSQKLDIIGLIKLQGASTPNSAVSSIIYRNFNSSGFDIVRLDARTGANIYEGVFAIQTNDVSGTMSDRLQVASNGTVSIGTSTQRQKLTVNGDIGIYKGSGQSRIFTVKGAAGTFSTLTITVNQYDYGCFVYDLKMHGYAGTYLHYAGGAYENGGIFGSVTTIAQKSPSATFTGPTYVSGHTWTITVTYASAWIHPVAEFSISGGGNFQASESDITMVWS